jgi:FAD/FMN-containing dehydrogenase
MGRVRVHTLAGENVFLPERTIQTWQAGLRGPLLRAGDDGYEEARRVWNGMIDRRPALIVRCVGGADVTHAVRFARAHSLLVAMRGGGHNIAGTAPSATAGWSSTCLS